MIRKLAGVILTAVMLLSLIPCAFAQTVAEGKCGSEATWVLDDAGTLTISGTGTLNVKAASSDYRWTSYTRQIKRVIVGEGITSIADNTFYQMTAMEEISLPESLTAIGAGAFYECRMLKEITIPAAVQTIGDEYSGAVYACRALESINVAEGNAYFKSVDGVLYNKAGTVLMQYPSGKQSVDFTIPDGVESLANGSIDYASALTSLTIPATVSEIEPTFFYCPKLEEINVASGNENFVSENGILFNTGKTELYRYPAAKQDTAYEIPKTVTVLKDYAFQGCYWLDDISIPDSVKAIGVSAFYDCISLREIYIPESVTKIYWSAFRGCAYLKKAAIAAKITDIESDLFSGCTALSEISLPDSLKKIHENAFEGCSALNTLSLPNGLEFIGEHVFYNCLRLKTIYLPDTLTYIGDVAFKSTGLTDVYYNGTETEWKAVEIGSNNVELVRGATIHCVPKPYINGALQLDGGTLTVPIKATDLDCTLAAAAYKNNKLLNVKTKALAKDASSDSITALADGADKIVVYIWDGLNSLEPMCESKSVTVE